MITCYLVFLRASCQLLNLGSETELGSLQVTFLLLFCIGDYVCPSVLFAPSGGCVSVCWSVLGCYLLEGCWSPTREGSGDVAKQPALLRAVPACEQAVPTWRNSGSWPLLLPSQLLLNPEEPEVSLPTVREPRGRSILNWMTQPLTTALGGPA